MIEGINKKIKHILSWAHDVLNSSDYEQEHLFMRIFYCLYFIDAFPLRDLIQNVNGRLGVFSHS